MSYQALTTTELAKKLASGDASAMAEMQARGAIKNGQLVPNWQKIGAGEVSTTQPLKQPSIKDFSTERLQKETAGIESIGGTPVNERAELEKRGALQLPPPEINYDFSNLMPQAKPVAPVTTPQAPTLDKERALLDEFYNREIERIRSSTEAQRGELPGQFLKEKTSASVQGQLGRNRLSESLANLGVLRSGEGVNRLTALEASTQGRLGDIQQSEIKAGQDLTRQESEGLSDVESQRLQQLMGITQRETDYERELAAIQEERAYQDKVRAEQMAAGNFEQEQQRALDTINRYSGDFQAEINKRKETPSTDDDWLIPYLESARQQKLSSMDQAAAEKTNAEIAAMTNYEKQTYDRGLEKWKAGIPVSAEEAQVLGVRPGSVDPKSQKTSGSGSGSGGLTPSQQWSRIKDKIEMGIPLTAEEQAILGGTPSNTKPPFETNTWESALDRIESSASTYDPALKRTIPNESVRQQQSAEFIMRNIMNGGLTEAQAADLIIKYNISERYMQLAEDALTGNLSLTPGR